MEKFDSEWLVLVEMMLVGGVDDWLFEVGILDVVLLFERLIWRCFECGFCGGGL